MKSLFFLSLIFANQINASEVLVLKKSILAQAEEALVIKLINKLVSLINIESFLKPVIEKTVCATSSNLTPVQVDLLINKLKNYLRSSVFLNKIKLIYKKYFTVTELIKLVELYESGGNSLSSPQAANLALADLQTILESDLNSLLPELLDELQKQI